MQCICRAVEWVRCFVMMFLLNNPSGENTNMRQQFMTTMKMSMRFVLVMLMGTVTLSSVYADWIEVESPSVPEIEEPIKGEGEGEFGEGGTEGTTNTLYETAMTPDLVALARALRHGARGE